MTDKEPKQTVEEITTPSSEIDLDKARDEKCIPIARAMLGDMVTDFLPEDPHGKTLDHRKLVTKFLSRSLEANLNITTEVSYLTQLVLGVLSGVNATVQTCTLTPIDQERYTRISQGMLKIMAESDVPMTNIKKEDMEKVYALVKVKLNELFATENATQLDVKYVMDNLLQGFTSVNNLFSQSLEQSSQKAEAKLFGIDQMNDLTIGKINEVLLS